MHAIQFKQQLKTEAACRADGSSSAAKLNWHI
jgi:hypothetical protein